MPTTPPAACRQPGCSGLVRGGVCSVCGPQRAQSQAAHDSKRGTAAQRGYDGRWQRLRLVHLAAHPLCAMCLAAGRVTAATLVDHILPVRDGGELLSEANLQSLCTECHASKTADDLARRKAARA